MAIRSFAFTIVIALAGSCLAAQPYMTATYEDSAGGFVLCFTIHNPLSETVDGWIAYTPDASCATAPEGWYLYQTDRYISWRALDLEHHVQPGASLEGFSFLTAQQQPAVLLWGISSRKGYFGSVTPTPIPEPSGLLALGSGLAAVCLPWIRRRVRGRD